MTKISAKQRKNLNKLADYLLALPKDYEHFDMNTFCSIPGKDAHGEEWYVEFDPSTQEAKSFPCGTVACAIGHAINAGIKNTKLYDNWWYYSNDYLLDTNSDEWAWCFHSSWHYVDNTPQGAGKRIKHLLDKGLPEDAYYQRHNQTPYIYK